METITTKSYLGKKNLEALVGRKLNSNEIFQMVEEGLLIKQFSYYKPTVDFLKSIGKIPNEIKIKDFNKLAKKSSFTLTEIAEIFECSKDIAKLIVREYFQKRHSLYYRKTELLIYLEKGKEVLEI